MISTYIDPNSVLIIIVELKDFENFYSEKVIKVWCPSKSLNVKILSHSVVYFK
jgi:hypothetical protein